MPICRLALLQYLFVSTFFFLLLFVQEKFALILEIEKRPRVVLLSGDTGGHQNPSATTPSPPSPPLIVAGGVCQTPARAPRMAAAGRSFFFFGSPRGGIAARAGRVRPLAKVPLGARCLPVACVGAVGSGVVEGEELLRRRQRHVSLPGNVRSPDGALGGAPRRGRCIGEDGAADQRRAGLGGREGLGRRRLSGLAAVLRGWLARRRPRACLLRCARQHHRSNVSRLLLSDLANRRCDAICCWRRVAWRSRLASACFGGRVCQGRRWLPAVAPARGSGLHTACWCSIFVCPSRHLEGMATNFAAARLCELSATTTTEVDLTLC
jgi:hypothetical protein